VVQNRAPTANAGADQTVNEGAAVTLSGSGTDPDGNTLTYAWAQTGGQPVTLSGGDSATATFTAPEVTADTVLTFTVTVSDGTLSSTDTVAITVRNSNQPPQNRAPTVNAGADQTVQEGGTVSLSGSAVDPDGDALTYAWAQTGGPVVSLEGANTAAATFATPDVSSDTILSFTLKVTDSHGLSTEDSVSVTVTAKTGGGGDGGGDGGGGCGCSSNGTAGPLMPLLMLGMALLSRRRWLR
jgi:MYXO-CTERM domain-containing protein